MNKQIIAYWGVTGILVFGLAFSGIGALLHMEFLVETMQHIGFPLYTMGIIGTAHTLAAIAIIVPVLPQLKLSIYIKEWAYAGEVLLMTAAFFTHLSIGDSFEETAPSLVIVFLTVASYLLRPQDSRLVINSPTA